jgi:hypothetical protein
LVFIHLGGGGILPGEQARGGVLGGAEGEDGDLHHRSVHRGEVVDLLEGVVVLRGLVEELAVGALHVGDLRACR